MTSYMSQWYQRVRVMINSSSIGHEGEEDWIPYSFSRTASSLYVFASPSPKARPIAGMHGP